MLQLCVLPLLLVGDPALGHWRAALGPPESEVHFDLTLALKSGALTAEIQNGEEHIAVPEVVWHGSDLVLGFPYYDSRITAKFAGDGKTLSGEWKKRSGKEKWTTLEFRAQAGNAARFPSPSNPKVLTANIGIAIAVGGSEIRGRLRFDAWSSGVGTGTVLSPTGDLRYLAGTCDGERLLLSEFDGFFAFLFDGRKSAQGYSGTCRMGGSTGTWTTAELTGSSMGGLVPEFAGARFPLEQLAFSDTDGIEHALAEPLSEGHPM